MYWLLMVYSAILLAGAIMFWAVNEWLGWK
jgi:hypothetical protein